ncbi:MAG: Holliday junction resolvase RuvX [Planctomycetota bacterium]
MPRYLGIDLGDKRTGLAVGDDVLKLAMPAGLIEVSIALAGDPTAAVPKPVAGDALLTALTKAAAEQLGRGEALVLGLPLNMDGTEGPRAKLVRAFGERLAERSGRAVHFQDERRTSVAADEKMARTGLTHGQKKRRRDALAAAAMLQAFLDGLGGPRAMEPAN